MNKKGFSLLELLVVILIIGILAAIALPQYQLAVDKARYAKIMDFTRSIFEAEVMALALTEQPTFDHLDIDMPPNCTITKNSADDSSISCDNGTWGCRMINGESYWTRCSDFGINGTLLYGMEKETYKIKRICYTHTLDVNDRANRMCQNITGKRSPDTPAVNVSLFTGKNINMNGYYF